ncbi:MAG: hypothetical protein CL543_14290 [Alcanivorax sp.]|nr:hypothetical protein [Alcanivorax sp.]MBU60031.1 hypothetical protein [Alcanivorax sp.]|tara:strand:+ start:1746 stop:4304 length:2559 start_codon:yes stop_codon:yes gene_type:complete
MALLIRPISLFCLLLVLAACGGGGGGGGGGDAVDRPQARASADTTEVNAAEGTVHLDGGESTSPNGDITTWQWRFLSRPDGSEATLDGADTAQASFTPDLPGTYVIQLVVNDGNAGSGDTSASRVTITALNPNPLAIVTEQITNLIGTVQLDGSASLPPEGGDVSQLNYHWTLIQKPEGSEAELDDPTLAQPRFQADELGTYKGRLEVSYGEKTSQPAVETVVVVEANAQPVARIGAFETPVTRGEVVPLDGSGSSDADNDPLQYRWRFLRRPEGSQAVIDGARVASASFVPDVLGDYYRVELCVFDGTSNTCTTQDLFGRDMALPTGAANLAPVAVITNVETELELGAEAAINTASFDADNDALTYDWELLSHPDGFDPNSDDSLKNYEYCFGTYCPGIMTPSVEGEYTVQLTVSDGEATHRQSRTFTARLGANRQPRAVAALSDGNPTTLVGHSVTFDGAGSSDPDDNRLSYAWTLRQKPDNSAAELENATSVSPTLLPDVAGRYVVSLRVTDEHGLVSDYRPGTDQLDEVAVFAKSINHLPVTRLLKEGGWRNSFLATNYAQFDQQQPLVITGLTRDSETYGPLRMDVVKLIADTYDPDGDTLSHLWNLISEPQGNRMELPTGAACNNGQSYDRLAETLEEYIDRVNGYREWTCDSFSLAPTEPGTYVFQYQTYDGSDFAGPFQTTVHAVRRENYPSLLLEASSDEYGKVGQSDGSDLVMQAVFPWMDTHAPDLKAESNYQDGYMVTRYFKLTAFGGDYRLMGVQTNSIKPEYEPRFWDETNQVEITDGYTIPQGGSVVVAFQVPISSDDPEEEVGCADINGSFHIDGHPDWTVTLSPFWTGSGSVCSD